MSFHTVDKKLGHINEPTLYNCYRVFIKGLLTQIYYSSGYKTRKTRDDLQF